MVIPAGKGGLRILEAKVLKITLLVSEKRDAGSTKGVSPVVVIVGHPWVRSWK